MPESQNFSAEVISGGRITIPEHIRIDLNIKEGDRVRIIIQKAINIRGEIIQ